MKISSGDRARHIEPADRQPGRAAGGPALPARPWRICRRRAESELHAVLLRSSVPHGRIRSIDTSAALKCPGGRAVITARRGIGDIPVITMRQELLPEFKPYQQPVIARDKVAMSASRSLWWLPTALRWPKTRSSNRARHRGAAAGGGSRHFASDSPIAASTRAAAATAAPRPSRGAGRSRTSPRRWRRSRIATAPAQISAAAVPGTSIVASNAAGWRCRPLITTRLVGLPCTTAIEKAFATPIVASSSGRAGAPRSTSASTTGTITTTAPSSESAAVRSAQTRQTRAYTRAVPPPAARARMPAIAPARPVASASRASQMTAVRKQTSGTEAESAAPSGPGQMCVSPPPFHILKFT